MVPRWRKSTSPEYDKRLRTKAGGPRMRCAVCPCLGVGEIDCCPDNNFPAILNCAVSEFGDCDTPIDITLRWNSGITKWEGSHTYNDGGGGGTTTMSVTFYCAGTDNEDLILKYVLPNEGPDGCDYPGEWVGQLPTQQCSPLNCHYAEMADPEGCRSCDGTGIDFVVTEKA
jgi:hypothetical protein